MKLFKNKILVGHGIDNDFIALDYEHPKNLRRDTSKYKVFQNGINQPYSLRHLTEKYLNRIIQQETHDSIEDARAALCLYKLHAKDIENEVMSKNHKLIRKKVLEDAKTLKSLFGI